MSDVQATILQIQAYIEYDYCLTQQTNRILRPQSVWAVGHVARDGSHGQLRSLKTALMITTLQNGRLTVLSIWVIV
jgi:hypothetical protein